MEYEQWQCKFHPWIHGRLSYEARVYRKEWHAFIWTVFSIWAIIHCRNQCVLLLLKTEKISRKCINCNRWCKLKNLTWTHCQWSNVLLQSAEARDTSLAINIHLHLYWVALMHTSSPLTFPSSFKGELWKNFFKNVRVHLFSEHCKIDMRE